MIVYKCKMCNGNLDMGEWKRLVKCGYCDTFQSVPSLIDENKAEMVNRANRFRQSGEFDKAQAIFEQILADDDLDPEIYWSVVLCKFGVEYVEDPASREIKPTVNRTQAHSILQDADFQNAIAHADAEAKDYYMAEAEKIETIQESIWRIAQDAEDYDVFISYKEKAPDGSRSDSSVIAQNLYEKLEAAGFKTFYSRISLQDKVGTEFEPYIYSALNSAEVMLVVGTRSDEFTAPWVKNEWSRFRNIVNQQITKKLIPCFKDLTIEDLPDDLQAYQGQDIGKEGYEQELIQNIRRIVSAAKTVPGMEVGVTEEKLWKNADTFLYLKDYDKADQLYTELCRQKPSDPRGWWGKVRAITCDFTEYKTLKTRYTDLKNWMGYLKKLSTEESYAQILERYIVYLNQASKQMVPDEIERVKKMVKEDKLYIEQAQDFMRNRQNGIAEEDKDYIKQRQNYIKYKQGANVRRLDELEKMKKAQEIKVSQSRQNMDNAATRLKNRKVFLGILIAMSSCYALVALILLAAGETPGSLALVFLSIIFMAFMSCGFISKKSMQNTLATEQEKYNTEVAKFNQILAEINDIVYKEDAMQKKIYTNLSICNEVIVNAEKYLNYGEEAIGHLLFNMMCREAGVNQPLDQEMFAVRQRIFQKLL